MTDYLDVTDVMAEMPDVDWSGKYRETLAALVTRASRMIDVLTGREPGAYAVETATIRYFDGSGCREQWLDEMAAAPTAVAVDETGGLSYTAWASTDYAVWPYNALATGKPLKRLDIDLMNGDKAVWYKFPRSVKVTAKWGYSTTPPGEVYQATLIQSMRWFKRAQQAFQDTGAIVDLGQLRYVQALDPDIATIVTHLRRVTI